MFTETASLGGYFYNGLKNLIDAETTYVSTRQQSARTNLSKAVVGISDGISFAIKGATAAIVLGYGAPLPITALVTLNLFPSNTFSYLATQINKVIDKFNKWFFSDEHAEDSDWYRVSYINRFTFTNDSNNKINSINLSSCLPSIKTLETTQYLITNGLTLYQNLLPVNWLKIMTMEAVEQPLRWYYEGSLPDYYVKHTIGDWIWTLSGICGELFQGRKLLSTVYHNELHNTSNAISNFPLTVVVTQPSFSIMGVNSLVSNSLVCASLNIFMHNAGASFPQMLVMNLLTYPAITNEIPVDPSHSKAYSQFLRELKTLKDKFHISKAKSFEDNINAVLRWNILDQVKNGIPLPDAIHTALKLAMGGDFIDHAIRSFFPIIQNTSEKIIIKALNQESLPQELFAALMTVLIDKNTKAIEKLKSKYNLDMANTIYNAIRNHEDITKLDRKVGESVQKITKWLEFSQEEQSKLLTQQGYLDAFQFLSRVGSATGCEPLYKVANIAIMGMTAYNAINALSAVASIGAMLTPATAIANVALTLFSMMDDEPKSDQTMQEIFKQLQQISEQIIEFRMEVRKQFRIVFIGLNHIINMIEKQYDKMLGLSYQSTLIYNAIIAHDDRATLIHLGKENLLKELKQDVSEIIDGNDAYIEALTHQRFNRMFYRLRNWLKDKSFDPACNGYTKAIASDSYSSVDFSVPEKVIDALKAPVKYRLGYLAAYLQMPNPEKMVFPDTFNYSANGLKFLIDKGFSKFGKLPIDSFNEEINQITKNLGYTKTFIRETQTKIKLSNQLQNYKQAIINLKDIISEWAHEKEAMYNINILKPLDDIYQQANFLNERTHFTVISGVYKGDYFKCSPHLQNIINRNPTIGEILKYASILERLKFGEIRAELAVSTDLHQHKYAYQCTGNIKSSIFIGFIRNQGNQDGNKLSFASIYFESGEKSIHADDDYHWAVSELKPHRYFQEWNTDWSNTVTISSSYDDDMKTAFRNTIISKLKEIRSELTSIENKYGVKVNAIRIEIQKQYMVTKALYELHGISADDLPYSGDAIIKEIEAFANGDSCEKSLTSLDKPSLTILDCLTIKASKRFSKLISSLPKTIPDGPLLQDIHSANHIISSLPPRILVLSKTITTGKAFIKDIIIDELNSGGCKDEASLVKKELQYDHSGGVNVNTIPYAKTVLFRAFMNGANSALVETSDLLDYKGHSDTALSLRTQGSYYLKKLKETPVETIFFKKPGERLRISCNTNSCDMKEATKNCKARP